MSGESPQLAWTNPEVRQHRSELGRLHGSDSDIKRLIEIAEPKRKDRALDLVTGLGTVALALAPLVKRVDAIDPDGELLAEARQAALQAGAGNIQFTVGDPSSIDSPDAQYDLVTARMAMRHLPELSGCLREIRRVLKPDGRVVLDDLLKPYQPELASFTEKLLKQRDRSHVRAYSMDEWENMLDREGFDIELVEVVPRKYEFGEWARDAQGGPDAERMLAAMFRGAGPRTKRHFRLVEKDGYPVSFVLWMILIRAVLRT